MTHIKKFCSLVAGASMGLAALSPTPSNAQEPFLGQIILVGFNFCPRGFASADGQILPISENQSLYSLYGTMYGGDGRTTFALPDLRGRMAINSGNGPGLPDYRQGVKSGWPTQTLTANQMPSHNHLVNVTNVVADKGGPKDKILAAASTPQVGPFIYSEAAANKTMRSNTIANTGGSQSFSIQNPFVALKYCVATTGLYPSRS